jgi:phosphoglycerol transferase MdoB-like AlkP superfamily enzyme
MKTERLKRVLAWSIIINYLILIIWFFVFVLAHDQLRDLHTRWFKLSAEQFDLANYLGIAIYKIGIMLFFLVPYIAMRITDRGRDK